MRSCKNERIIKVSHCTGWRTPKDKSTYNGDKQKLK